jgi:3-hydroxyacyl-CoA dehydrogenase
MGTGIAAHLRGAGLEVLLLDIVPPASPPNAERKSARDSGHAGRNRLAINALQQAARSKPAVFHDPADAALIEVGNFDDDLAPPRGV